MGFMIRPSLISGRFFYNTLKGNEFLNFAILTGVLRIAKESIFSGLNNLDVYSVMDEEYSSVMGFTTAEVEKWPVIYRLMPYCLD